MLLYLSGLSKPGADLFWHLLSWALPALFGPAVGWAQAPPAAFPKTPESIRFATFNVSLYRSRSGQLARELADGRWPQAQQLAAIIQYIQPDVLLLNEIDFEPDGRSITLFHDHYLAASQGGLPPITFTYRFTAAVNTGLPSGCDLDGDGQVAGPGDHWGYGNYPGQYGMAVLSRYPIDAERVRTFQRFRWKDMPGGLQPSRDGGQTPFYRPEIWEQLRLSSKSHWDVPVQLESGKVHLLVCHPTPPVFDGPEDRNGRRNHDEIRFWIDYVTPGAGEYIYDDRDGQGGLAAGSHFVIAGDLNADPRDGDSRDGVVQRLLEHPLIHGAPAPRSQGAVEKSQRDGRVNHRHRGDPAEDTADFADNRSGNLRVDYVLPSRSLRHLGSGVFWPGPSEPPAEWLGATDHRLVWVDVALP